MTNDPYGRPDSVHRVLINDAGQYSLWPAFLPIPTGWYVVHEGGSREACLQYVDNSWNDMRPNAVKHSF